MLPVRVDVFPGELAGFMGRKHVFGNIFADDHTAIVQRKAQPVFGIVKKRLMERQHGEEKRITCLIISGIPNRINLIVFAFVDDQRAGAKREVMVQHAMAWDGVQQCLPNFAATIIMYYQIDIFEAAGIESPPTTYDELLEIAPLVHTDEVPLIALRGNPPAAHGNIWQFNSFFHGEGAKFFVDFPNDLTPTVNSPEAIRALTNFVALKNNYGPEGVAAYQYPEFTRAMQQGTVVMVMEGAPLAGRILDPEESKVSDNFGFAVVPGGAAGPKPSFAAHGICVTADSEHQEAAYTFLEWAMSFDTMKKIALAQPHIAVTRDSLWEDEDFIAKYDYDFGGGSFLKAFQDSLAAAPADYYPPFAGWPLMGDILGQAVQEAEIGARTPEDALNHANELITQMLEDEGYLP